MAADSRAFERMTFSDFTCAEDLTKAFGNTYIARPTVRPPSTVLPRFVRADMTDTEWGAACDAYADFFAEGDISGNTRSHEVEGPLRPLFDFVALNAGPGLFKNGAGKVFLYELLKIVPHRKYNVCLSTTAHSGFDWCGYCHDGEDPVGGLVDILITYPEVVPGLRVIGEIEPKLGEGLWQLLAAMQKEAYVRKKWPLGFLASPDTLKVVEFDKIIEKESGFGRMIPKVYLRIFTFITYNLNDLVRFADKVLSPFLGPAGPSLASEQLGVVTRSMSRLEIKYWKERKYGRDSDSIRETVAVAAQKISEAAAVISEAAGQLS